MIEKSKYNSNFYGKNVVSYDLREKAAFVVKFQRKAL